MKLFRLLITVAPLALATPAHAEDAAVRTDGAGSEPASAAPAQQTFSTGVARARDALDSATSTSTLTEVEIEKFGARSLSEVFRNMPGMRSESTGGDGNANISIRGLPIALGGAKFLQLQENGLPTLEFGDIAFATGDTFLRADLNLAAVQAIRGGSASTFASNSPGGIVNLIDKTGTTDGGEIEATTGLDYSTYRIDFDYGGHLSKDLHFNIGGFYRQGEGPRPVGFDAYKGGQLKFNLTREFTGGYVRFYAKLLDDRTPVTSWAPVKVTGTNANPQFTSLAGFDYGSDLQLSRYIPGNVTLDENNNLARHSYADGTHAKVKSFGVETQFELSDWTVTDRFRFSDISGSVLQPYELPADLLPFNSVDSAGTIMAILGAPGGTLSYATGPNAGQAVATPSTLNGNGLLSIVNTQDVTLNSLNNVTNDLRASRVWSLGNADVTLTGGFYKSSQDINSVWAWSTLVTDVLGGGNAHLMNVATAGGTMLTTGGFYAYGSPFFGYTRRDVYDLNYSVNAPYASVNYHAGKLSVGGSLRYDFGSARGTIYGTSLLANSASTVISKDMNGDGVVAPGSAETRVSQIPLGAPAPVNYNYHYLSYSAGLNYRAAEDLSLFARYSKGGRASADRILFANYVSPTSGALLRPEAAYDPVQQAEAGVKYRTPEASLYLTGFWAKTKEHNIGLDRGYRAYGVELEGSWRRGVFQLNGGATFTKAKITADALNASNVGHIPKHQADLIFQITPQIELRKFTFGVNAYGTTNSYVQDRNLLKMPGYTVFNGFLQYRPGERMTLSLNANNLFDKAGLVEVNEGSIPANGIVTARTVNPRTVSASVRLGF